MAAKQGPAVWNKDLYEGLTDLGFKQSNYDLCVYYRKDVVYLNYTDDGILASPNKESIDKVIGAP